MGFCGRKAFFVLAVSMGMLLLRAAYSPVMAQPYEEEVDWLLKIRLDYPGLGIQDTISLRGPAGLGWFEPYPSLIFPPHLEVDADIDTIRLWNRSGVWGNDIPGFPIHGKGFLLPPEPGWRAFSTSLLSSACPSVFRSTRSL